MAVEIIARNIRFYNQFKNGVNFTDNLGDFTTNLTGSVMAKVKAIQELDISWNSEATEGSKLFTISQSRIDYPQGDYKRDGFALGDNVVLHRIDSSGVVLSTHAGTIASLTRTVMIFTNNLVPPLPKIGEKLAHSIIYGDTDITASFYKFGLLENSEDFSAESSVTGSEQGYYAGGIGVDNGGGRSTAFVDMQRLGNFKGWQSGSMRIRYVSNPSQFTQRFEVEHTFIIPYFKDGEEGNIENSLPTPNLEGLNSLKYSFSPGFRTVLSNPNTEKKAVINDNLGSVGYYDENFNGFQNNYKITSVGYNDADTGASSEGLIIGGKTQVFLIVEKIGTTFVAGDRFGAYVSYLPEAQEYTETTETNLQQNFLYDNALTNSGQAPVASQKITNFTVIAQAFSAIIVFDVEYSTTEKLRLSQLASERDINFVIGIEVGDASLSNGNSDRVMLSLFGKYDQNADIEGLFNVPKFDILTHEKQLTDAATTDVIVWNEDGLLIDYSLELDLNKDALLNSLEFLLVAYNPTSKQFFELDKYIYNAFPTIISNGVQQININETRGYPLGSNDDFNKVTLTTAGNTSGVQAYEGLIGQKISWQDWLQNLSADSIFYDSIKPNNNLNYKTSNYSSLNGYEIRMAFFANVYGTNDVGVSGFTDYLVTTPNLTVYDYEKDGNITPKFSAVVETFNADGTNSVEGSVLSGEDTLLRVTWTSADGAITDLNAFWGLIRVEETGQGGYDITECSSVIDTPANQLLKPISGQTKLFTYLNSGNLVMECLTNGAQISEGVSYNISSTIKETQEAPINAKMKAGTNIVKMKAGTTTVKQKAGL